MNIQETASRAKRLRADEDFQNLIQEIRDDAIASFVNSAAADVEAREDAHAIMRAINKIDSTLAAKIDAQTVAEKKGQHRGNV